MAETISLNSGLIYGFAPQRPEDGHKNTFGTAVICCGSEFMTGAAVMATGAALRSGAGLVKVFSEEKTLAAVSCNEPCALLELRPSGTAEMLRKASVLCENSTAVLIGSGIPSDWKELEALESLFIGKAANLVLDAGALIGRTDVFSRLAELLRARTVPAVITPHIGEFARLTGLKNSEVISNAEELVSGFAEENNVVVVLKSAKTLIAAPDGKIFVHEASNSGLAKGGSGDVLAGLLTGFLAQGMDPCEAACSAVFIHSAAGEAAAEDLGVRSMLPTDLEFYFRDAYREAGWEQEDE